MAAVLLSLVGAYYYLRVVKLMYFDEPKEAAPATPAHGGVLMSVNGLALLLFGIVPGPLMDLCTVAIASL